MATASINRLIQLFENAMQALGSSPSMPDIERLAMVIHRCMGAKTRAYHTTAHVFGLCEGANPVQTLAALFHDTVYYQLDGGTPEALRETLHDVIEVRGSAVYLAQEDGANQPCVPDSPCHLLSCVNAIFGYQPGQALPAFGGMNEFLSAVAAVRLLSPFLSCTTLLHIAACIEATIAFRSDGPDGVSALDRLQQRIQAILTQAPHYQTPETAVEHANAMVFDAMELANRDVSGFAEADPAVFLAQTWLLIEESNKPLAAVGLYTIQEYRLALERMDGFLANLNPRTVFQKIQGVPDTASLHGLVSKAQSNIAFSVRYLRAKLLAMALLDAFASASGGNAPISMFLGEFDPSDANATSDVLPPIPAHADCDPSLLRVLTNGRARASAADQTASPTAAFIYRALGERGLVAQWECTRQYFTGATSPRNFLHQWPIEVVLPLLEVSAATALSRRALLDGLRKELAPR